MTAVSQSKLISQFLAAYRSLETALRTVHPDLAIRDYEAKLLVGSPEEADRGDKLKVCRILRNYAQHNADGMTFIAASPVMTEFLINEADSLMSAIDTVRKHRVMPAIIITNRTKISEAAAMFAKTSSAFLPYQELPHKGAKPPISAIIAEEDVLAAIAGGARLSSPLYSNLPAKNEKAAVARYQTAVYVTLNTLYSDVKNCPCVLITSDGTADGRYSGIVR